MKHAKKSNHLNSVACTSPTDPVTGIPVCSTSLNNNTPYTVIHNYNLLVHSHVLPHFQHATVATSLTDTPERYHLPPLQIIRPLRYNYKYIYNQILRVARGQYIGNFIELLDSLYILILICHSHVGTKATTIFIIRISIIQYTWCSD